MTAARAGRLHVGDFVRFDDAVHEVVGLDGAVTILMSEAGRRVVMKVDALLCDPTFEMIDSRRRRRSLPPAYFESLPTKVWDKARWLEARRRPSTDEGALA
jgi:putative transposase